MPMRTVAPGFYPQLWAMYKYLGIRLRTEKFIYTFCADSGNEPDMPEPYYHHASNLHRILPGGLRGTQLIRYGARLAFLAVCYIWMCICCFFITPKADEALGSYLSRNWVPDAFTNHYLLPFLSGVATCSHDDLRRFPASDFVDWRRKMFRAEHYTVENGVWDAERTLVRGIDVRVSTSIEEVIPSDDGRVQLRCQSEAQGSHIEHFDQVILATSPNIIARIFPLIASTMGRIPTADVHSVILQPRTDYFRLSVVDPDRAAQCKIQRPNYHAQLVDLRSRAEPVPITATYQQLANGARVATNAKETFEKDRVITEASFTRVLRTVESRRLVEDIFDERKGGTGWKNGQGGVWLAGAWCWDGMVLLEGCVVSATRVAKALDVNVPWEIPEPRR